VVVVRAVWVLDHPGGLLHLLDSSRPGIATISCSLRESVPLASALVAFPFCVWQAASMSDPESSPVQIGDFRIIKQIGAGGMGIVYLAKQVSLDRLVALKVLGRSLDRPSDIARFQREAQAVARLEHPNIATIHFVGQDKRLCYLAMQYIDGVSLREVIDRLARTTQRDSSIDDLVREHADDAVDEIKRFDEPAATVVFDNSHESDAELSLTPAAQHSIATKEHIQRCCEIVRDVAHALAHAHEQGVIHRDMKPDNLMLGKDSQVHIIDFGVARFFEDATLTQTGALVGTPIYMSPEQVTGRIELDHRTDIYSRRCVAEDCDQTVDSYILAK